MSNEAHRARLSQLLGISEDASWADIIEYAERRLYRRIEIEMPDGDERKAKIWFSEVKDGVLNISICVTADELVPPRPLTEAEQNGIRYKFRQLADKFIDAGYTLNIEAILALK